MLTYFFSERLEDTVENLEKELNCAVCYTSKKCMKYDCGHVSTCEACAKSNKTIAKKNEKQEIESGSIQGPLENRCPICRQKSKKPVFVII